MVELKAAMMDESMVELMVFSLVDAMDEMMARR